MKNTNRYEQCPKCRKQAVHMATSNAIVFHGDYQDLNGDETEYSEALLSTYVMYEGETVINHDICIGVHACFECGELIDVWVESPREQLADAVYDLPNVAQRLLITLYKLKRHLRLWKYRIRSTNGRRTSV